MSGDDAIAGSWLRIAAFLIDQHVQGLAAWAVIAASGAWRADDEGLQFVVAMAVVQAAWIYRVIGHATWGRTLGKLVVGIRVVRADNGDRIDYGEAMMREWPWIIASTVPFLALASLPLFDMSVVELVGSMFLVLFFTVLGCAAWLVAEAATMVGNPRHQSLHDMFAGTVVMRVGATPLPLEAETR